MQNGPKDFERLSAHVAILVRQNAESQAQIVILEDRLSESERRIQELQESRADVTASSEDARASRNGRRMRALQNDVTRLQQQQQQQDQYTFAKFQKLDKLQHLLTGGILNAQKSHERESRMEQISSQLKSVQKAVEDLQADSSRTSHRLDSLGSRCTSLRHEFEDFKSSWSRAEEAPMLRDANIDGRLKSVEKRLCQLQDKVAAIAQDNNNFDSRLDGCERKNVQFEGTAVDMQKEVDVLSHKVASVDYVNRSFESRLYDCENKSLHLEGSLSDMQKQMDTMTHKGSSIESGGENYYLARTDTCLGACPNDEQEQMDSLTHRDYSIESDGNDIYAGYAVGFQANLSDMQKRMDFPAQEDDPSKSTTDTFDYPTHVRAGKDAYFQDILNHMQKQMYALTQTVSSIDQDNDNFASRLRRCEEKVVRHDGTLEDVQKRMDTLSHNVASIQHDNDTFGTRLHESERKITQSDGILNDMQDQISEQRESLTLSDQKIHVLDRSVNLLNRQVSEINKVDEKLKYRLLNSEKEVEHVKDTLTVMQREMSSLTSSVSSFETGSKTLESRLANSEGKIENVESNLTDMKKQVNTCNNDLCTVQRRNEEEWLRRKFHMHMKLVGKHYIPLDWNEYLRLACLESIAEIPNGSAFKVLTNECGGDSSSADALRKQDTVKELRDHEITTPVQAMTEYIKLCSPSAPYTPDTQFYIIFEGGRRHIILGINKSHLHYITCSTKQELEKWPVEMLRKCQVVAYQIEVTFNNGRIIKFTTVEKINTDICKTIRSLIRK